MDGNCSASYQLITKFTIDSNAIQFFSANISSASRPSYKSAEENGVPSVAVGSDGNANKIFGLIRSLARACKMKMGARFLALEK